MARTKKRKAPAKKMWNSKKKKGKSVDNGVTEMFKEFADNPDDSTNSVISMEGIASLGEKLDMDVTEDVRILVLLFKMGIQKPSISYSEWTEGCEKLKIDSFESLQEIVPGLDTGFLETSQFKSFYKFCFKFNLSGTYKSLDKEVVLALLPMLLKDSHRVPDDRLESFTTFLESKEAEYAKITLDQWTSFLDFCLEVTNLDAFEESTSAWPVLIDEYVEYLLEQQ